MKKFTLLVSLVMLFAFAKVGWGQALLEENFSYTVGDNITSHGWAAHSGSGTNPIKVSASSISYANYPSSGIGGEVTLTTSGEDDNHTITEQTSGSVYTAFLVNVTSATLTGDYFFHMGQTTIGSTFRGKIFAKKDASGNLLFGLSFASNTGTYASTTYSLGTTYLLVLKYTIISGTGNDVASLFINPAINGIEPLIPDLTLTEATGDLANVGTVALRQGAAANAPALKLDGIRVGTSWSDILPNPTGGTNPPTGLTISKTSADKMNITWAKPSGTYGTDWDGVALFVRQGAANDVAVTGTDGSAYTGNTAFGSGTPAGNGYCVANQTTDADGDITITNLTEGQAYYVIAYTYKTITGSNNDTWSVASSEVNKQAEVQGVNGFTANSGNTVADLSWTNYSGAQGTWWDEVMILAKAGSVVDGTPVGNGSAYTANVAFGLGTQIGTENYVVYKGTGTNQTVTGLTNGTNYYYRVFVRYGNSWTDADQYKDANGIPYGEYRTKADGNWNAAPT